MRLLSVARIGVHLYPRLSRPLTPGSAGYSLIATEIAEHVAGDACTEREIEILRGVAAEKSNKLIAAELGISDGTPARAPVHSNRY